jgi:hypothetical protein
MGNKMADTNIKEKASKLIKELPDDASWDDLMYKIYVLQSIESGISDSENNKVLSVNEVREKFGFKE